VAGATLASVIIWRAFLDPSSAFVGDLIVVLYLLTMPAVAVIVGSFASRNPLASLGGSREMKLLMAYELPLLLVVMVPVIHTHSIRLGEIMTHPVMPSLSGLLALIVAALCMQAKLTLVPFDAPEAETELAGGAYIEYSGPPLAMYKLTRAMMLFTMPVFLVAVFWGGIPFVGLGSFLLGLLKYVILVVVIVLIRNTAPRLRVDQIVGFFWGPVTIAALAAVVLALLGL
jgi:NADH-quinone oxidoreductase subunit H